MRVSKTRKILCAASLFLAWTLPAQADYEDPIARCAKIAMDSARIACLEDALRNPANRVPVRSSAAEPAPEPAPVPASEPARPAATAPAVTAEVRVAAGEDVPAADSDARQADQSFGLKEKRPPKERDAIQVTVMSVTKNLRGKLVFATDGGQIWLQTDQRVARFGDTPFGAEIRPASMGSFFIRPNTGGVSVRVRREE